MIKRSSSMRICINVKNFTMAHLKCYAKNDRKWLVNDRWDDEETTFPILNKEYKKAAVLHNSLMSLQSIPI